MLLSRQSQRKDLKSSTRHFDQNPVKSVCFLSLGLTASGLGEKYTTVTGCIFS